MAAASVILRGCNANDEPNVITKPRVIVNTDGEVDDNLISHAEGYPTPEYLKSIIRTGNIHFEGDMKEEKIGRTFIGKYRKKPLSIPSWIRMPPTPGMWPQIGQRSG
jgi:hypothetical protein